MDLLKQKLEEIFKASGLNFSFDVDEGMNKVNIFINDEGIVRNFFPKIVFDIEHIVKVIAKNLNIEKGRELAPAEKVGRQMMYIGPVLTVVILSNLPAAVGLYWFITSAFSVVQQIYINKTLNLKKERNEHGITQTKTGGDI